MTQDGEARAPGTVTALRGGYLGGGYLGGATARAGPASSDAWPR